METDYYKILGVERNASKEDISKAYRKKAMMYHPDRQHGKTESEKKESESMFKKCSEAYETLSDNNKRAHYDKFGNTQGFQGGFGGQNFDPREFFRRHMQGFGFGGGFGDFGGFSSFGFGGDMGGSKNNPNSPKDGEDIRLKIQISLEDALYGAKKSFSIDIEDRCSHCHGTCSEDGKTETCDMCGGSGMISRQHGMMLMQSTCPKCHGSGGSIKNVCHKCHGSGKEHIKRKLDVDIPVGINNGEYMILNGKGQSGLNGGKPGDVLIFPIISNHEIYTRMGNNLGMVLSIDSITAILGGKVDVVTPWGTAELKIPSGTTTGKKFNMSGMGMKTKNGKGNLEVVINVENISNLSKKQMELITQLKDTLTEKNYPNTESRNNMMKQFGNKISSLRKDS